VFLTGFTWFTGLVSAHSKTYANPENPVNHILQNVLAKQFPGKLATFGAHFPA
jgi:short subunit fatty acids transporter